MFAIDRLQTRAGLLGIALLASAAPALGQSGLSISGNALAAGSDGSSGSGFYDDPSFSDSSQSLSVLSNFVNAAGTGALPNLNAAGEASALAYVSQGYIRLAAFASGSISNPTYAASFSARADAGYSDSVVLSNPSLNGQIGTFTPVVRVHILGHSLAPFGSAYSVDFTVGDQGGSASGIFSDSGDDAEIALQIPTVTFTYGQPFTIACAATVSVIMGGNNEDRLFPSGSVLASFPGSIQWMGMTGLESGTFVSQGAIDWSQAAPTPAPSAATLLACAGCLGVHRRRRPVA